MSETMRLVVKEDAKIYIEQGNKELFAIHVKDGKLRIVGDSLLSIQPWATNVIEIELAEGH